MTNSYTGSDIEIHLSDWLQGMETDGIDVEASLRQRDEMVREALEARYPQFSVSVFSNRAHGFCNTVVRYPTIPGIPESDWQPVIEEALQSIEARLCDWGQETPAWIVETAHA